MQSLDSGCSLVETLETVNGCSLVPLTCRGIPVLLHSESRCPFFPHLPHVEFLALHILECSLVQFGAPQ